MLTPAISISQNLNNYTNLNIVDVSTGSDSGITSRQVLIKNYQGNYLTPNGIFTTPTPVSWAYANSTIAINVLSQDLCLSITVNWIGSTGNVLYTVTQLKIFTLYNENALYLLTLQQVANYKNIYDTQYYDQKKALRLSVDQANISFAMNDIVNAQNRLNTATQISLQLVPQNTTITASGAAPVTTYIGYWTWSVIDPYTTLQTSDPYTYQSGNFLLGSALVSDMHLMPVGYYPIWKEPSTQPIKTTWNESEFNYGQIPDSVIRAGFVVNGNRYYVGRNPTTFNNDPDARVSLIP
jgi:hypothetical protein